MLCIPEPWAESVKELEAKVEKWSWISHTIDAIVKQFTSLYKIHQLSSLKESKTASACTLRTNELRSVSWWIFSIAAWSETVKAKSRFLVWKTGTLIVNSDQHLISAVLQYHYWQMSWQYRKWSTKMKCLIFKLIFLIIAIEKRGGH